MTRTELYTFVTSLLDGYEMDLTLFNTFLDVAQMRREGQRPWVQLRGEDSSLIISTANTFETEKSLPTDFRRWYARYSVATTDPSGNLAGNLLEVPMAQKNNYRSDSGKFYVNYGTRKIYFCGSPSQTLTAHLFYIRKGTLVSSDAAQEWEFPAEYHKILGFDIAVMWKLGVDYDIVNNPQGNNNAAMANMIYDTMADWDNELQLATVQGASYGQASGWSANGSGGRLGPDVL